MKRFFKKIIENVSIFVAQKPGQAVLLTIIMFNICFVALSAVIISALSLSTVSSRGFWESIYYTVTMILDAGCIQFVVEDAGQAGAAIIIVCLIIIVIGMITFTGAIIGYVTTRISDFIENTNAGNRKLKISDHTIILNWNSRASEIVNDLIYSERNETVVILASSDVDDIKREIGDRIGDTLARENKEVFDNSWGMKFFKRRRYIRKNTLKNRLSIIIREGDVFSSKQLSDISVDTAKSIIILGKDITNQVCKFNYKDQIDSIGRGNSNIIKTLIQVADITASDESADHQKIVVEVEDDWTLSLVNQIIQFKEKEKKCNIVPVPVNRILGQILSQFSVMPELNQVYRELFSNKGAFFASHHADSDAVGENQYIKSYLDTHVNSIPITLMDTKIGKECFYMVDSERAITETDYSAGTDLKIEINKDFWLPKKNIIILGHNSKVSSIMDGFATFRGEWNFRDGNEILNIMIIDDKVNLEKNENFEKYEYVTKVVAADLYEKEKIYNEISSFINANNGSISVLILSDDMAGNEEIDAAALTYLIYINEIIENQRKHNSSFKWESIDVIVEVLNPKNYDVVSSYSVNNVVISNRYISKMITQIGEHDAIFDFYNDILTYDSEENENYESKELYIKNVKDFLKTIPPRCTAYDLIRAIYNSGEENNKSIVLGYIRNKSDKIIFSGNQKKINVELKPDDKLIIFSNH